MTIHKTDPHRKTYVTNNTEHGSVYSALNADPYKDEVLGAQKATSYLTYDRLPHSPQLPPPHALLPDSHASVLPDSHASRSWPVLPTAPPAYQVPPHLTTHRAPYSP